MNIQLRPGETLLFNGDAAIVKSKVSVVQSEAAVTDQRLFVAEGDQVFDRADIAAFEEEKHGFGTKLTFRLSDGSAFPLIAPNQAGLKAAGMILTGQAPLGSMPEAPKLAAVKNGTAWLAAFGPLISSIIVGIVAGILWGSGDQWGLRTLLAVFTLRVVLVWLFLVVDSFSLQRQGYNPKQLGISAPITFPVYLFSRAKAFGHGKGYAITWCVLVALDLLMFLVAVWGE